MDANAASDGATPKFSALIEIPYDLRFASFALDWVSGLAGLAGGVQKELDSLRLASDETLAFLISSYHDAENWERIRVEFALLDDGTAEISMTNAGPPVHLERIPQYTPNAPSESNMDGLWYFLARKAVDDLAFENCGRDGWKALMKKRLANASFEMKTQAKSAPALARKTPFTTRLAVPDDAPGLVDLTYDTYRYSYPVESFYHEPKLRHALEKKEIISLLVEADGAIVGNSSFAISRHAPRCAYSGSLMIKPAFRQSQAIIHLLKAIDSYVSSGAMDVDLCYGSTVTTHTASQKVGARTGFHPLALHLAVCLTVDFRGMKLTGAERETLLICVRFMKKPELETLFLPKRHHSAMAGLLSQAGFQCRLSEEEAAPSAERAKISVEEDAVELSACITLTATGRDWAARLQKRIFSLKAKGTKTVIILIPAWLPVLPGLDREMASCHAVFTGVKPLSAKECYLVYSALSDPVDFDRILLHDPLAYALKEHSRQLFNEMIAELPE